MSFNVVLLLVEGGSGKQGSVKSVGDATNDSSYRSYVKIIWDVGGANDYRRGHEGSLDVKCVTAAKGEMYYKEHLPKLGNRERRCLYHVRTIFVLMMSILPLLLLLPLLLAVLVLGVNWRLV